MGHGRGLELDVRLLLLLLLQLLRRQRRRCLLLLLLLPLGPRPLLGLLLLSGRL